jgi:uncharacterized protein (TIGR03435 family)
MQLSRLVFLVLAAVYAVAADQPAFDVVSIKFAPPDARGMGVNPQPGRVIFKNVTLKFLIEFGWGVQDFRVFGVPAWGEAKRYNIEATPGGEENLKPRVQAMLADRFGLAGHKESREVALLDLVVAKPGKLQNAATDHSELMMSLGKITGRTAKIGQLAGLLSNLLRRPVIDQTGLTGTYDFDLAFALDESMPPAMKSGVDPEAVKAAIASVDSSAPSLYTEIENKLGLKLKSTKGQVEVVVVDKAEAATEN